MITSLQNAAIKNIVKLYKSSKERREQHLFVIEGARELSLALQSDYNIKSVYVCRDMFTNSKYPEVLSSLPDNIIFDISSSVFEILPVPTVVQLFHTYKSEYKGNG